MANVLKRLFKHPSRSQPDFEEISSVLEDIHSRLSSQNVNLDWSSVSSLEEFINQFSDLQQRIGSHDSSAVSELQILLAPTGDFQEIAISSGWGDAYLKLSSRFDWAIGSRA